MMRLAISLGVLLLAIMQASAQQPASPPPASQGGGFVNPFAACKSDISELCKDAPSGIGGRLQCLKANQDKLSPACMGAIQSVLGVVKAKAATMQNAPRPIKACQSDLATLCPDLTVGEGGRIKCLRDNAPKLSPGCADALKAAKAQAQDALKTCNADRERLCGTVGQKYGDQIKCLREKQAELSTECREVVGAAKSAAKAAAKTAGQAAKAEAGPTAAPPVVSAAPGTASAPTLKPTQ